VRPSNGPEQFRNYSLSGAPGKDYFRISVKAIPARLKNGPDGVVSNYFANQLKEGDTIDVAGPFGNICLSEEEILAKSPIILIGAGIGCTPLVSMLHAISEKNHERELHYMYITQNAMSHPLKEEIEQIQKKCPNMKKVILYSRTDTKSEYYISGKITKDIIAKYIAPHLDAQVYFLGPVLWMQDINILLLERGFGVHQLHYELFGPHQNLSNHL